MTASSKQELLDRVIQTHEEFRHLEAQYREARSRRAEAVADLADQVGRGYQAELTEVLGCNQPMVSKIASRGRELRSNRA